MRTPMSRMYLVMKIHIPILQTVKALGDSYKAVLIDLPIILTTVLAIMYASLYLFLW